MERPTLLGDQVLATEQALDEIGRQHVAPALARVAELRGQRRGGMASGRTKQVDEALAAGSRSAVGALGTSQLEIDSREHVGIPGD